jgi:hypothetical protein
MIHRIKFILIFLLLNFHAFAQVTNPNERKIVQQFINCFNPVNKEKIAAKIDFPYNRSAPLQDIKSKQEFIELFDQIFDAQLIKKIQESKAASDWSAMGYKGFMLENGIVWLNEDGGLKATNYMTSGEKQLRENIKNNDKKTVYPSLKKYLATALILYTKDYLIRVDKMGEYSYRYAAWKAGSKMSDKPEIVINNGEIHFEGSGGNHGYKFTNGDYTYDCSINVLSATAYPPADLYVYKGEKLIFHQEAYKIVE